MSRAAVLALAAAWLAAAAPPAAPVPAPPVPAPTVPTLTNAAPATTSTGARVMALPDDAIVYLPASAGAHPPLLVLLHGADHRPGWMIRRFAAEADARGLVLLAPTSKGGTWDSVARARQPASRDSALINRSATRFGGSRDSARVEAAIAALGAIVPVDRTKTVLAGFSDGATFALAMGMARAYDFAAVIAWSPGIALDTEGPARGRRVFVSHGRQDRVLSFTGDCAEIVPHLRSEGAAVTFLPFEGLHEVPKIAVDIFLDATFGPVAGASAHPLPTQAPVCHGASVDTGAIKLPS